MNKIFKWLLVAVMFTSMCACSSDETSQSSQVETSELSLSFFDASIESFDKTRADDDAPKTLKDYFDQLDIAIIPQDKTQNPNEIHVKQSSTDADFGKLSTRIPIGKYTLVAIASKKSHEVTITSPTLASFSDEHISDMASVCQEIDVKSGANTVNAVLHRSFTRLVILSTDKEERNVDKMVLTYKGKFSKSFNPTTGFGIADEQENTYTKNISLDHTGTLSTVKINFSTFIPEETVSLTVDIKLYSADNTLVRSLHFDDVKVQQGHVTTYTGPLFTAGSSLNFTFDNVSLVKSDYDVSFGD